MSCAILMSVEFDSDIVTTIESLLSNSIKPSHIFILLPKGTKEKIFDVAKAFTKSCCDSGQYSEEYTNDYYLIKKVTKDCTFVIIQSDTQNIFDLKNVAIEEVENHIDYFITAQAGSIYRDNYIDSNIEKLKIPNTGACYSDYIEDKKYIYLSCLYPTLQHNVPIKDIGVSNKNGQVRFKSSNLDLIKELYVKSIIRHIPQALFST